LPPSVAAMSKAGADIIVCHLGLTTGGSIGAETALDLDGCVTRINAWSEAALKVNPDVIILGHDGPISMPDDAEYVLKKTKNCHGFMARLQWNHYPPKWPWLNKQKRLKIFRFNQYAVV